VRIFGGGRIVSRIGKWDIGLLNMQTEETGDLSSENLGVLRIRRPIFNPYSNIGLIATSRLGNDGTYNFVYGADGTIKMFGDDYFKFALAQSMQDGSINKQASLNPTRAYLSWERRTVDGFTYLIEGSQVGESYNPGLGFEDRENYKSMNVKFKYCWFSDENSNFFQNQLSVRSLLIFNNSTGELESAQYGPKWFFETKQGFRLQIFPRGNYENISDTLFIDDDSYIPINDYNFNDIYLSFNSPSANPLMISTNLSYGSFYDGVKVSPYFSTRWSISKHFEIEATYQYNDVNFSKRNQHFTNHIGRLRSLVMLNTKLSLSSFVQYNSANEAISSNVRFRYNPSEGHDFYMVYNQSSLIDNNPTAEINPDNKYWTIIMKYNYTFKL